MKKNVLLFIGAVGIILFVLLKITSHFSAIETEKGKALRDERSITKEMISMCQAKDSLINDSLLGKTIVINHWATWCGPCMDEIPELNKMAEENSNNKNIVFIALNADVASDELETMQQKKIVFKYRLLFQKKKLMQFLSDLALPSEGMKGGIPVNIIIDANGKINHFHIGNMHDELEKMKQYLSQLN